MSDISISPLYPHAPDAEVRRIGVPVTQEALSRLTDSMNHLAVIRSGRSFSVPIEWEPTTSFALVSSHILYDDPQGVSGEHRITWIAGPYADRLALRVEYQASDVYSAAPSIGVELLTRAGANVDLPGGGDAVTWSVTNGFLPAGRRPWSGPAPENPGAFGVANFPQAEYPVYEVSTGTGSDGAIRTLDISGAAGVAVELVVTYTSCRPLWVDVTELPVETVQGV